MAATSVDRKQLCSDLLGYLQTLSPIVLGKLYVSPSTCLAVYRELPQLCKLFIMRMLFIEQPISKQVISSWVSTGFQSEYMTSSDKLNDLQIWQTTQIGGGINGWSLHSAFRRSLKTALLGGDKSATSKADLGVDKYAKDVNFLNKYALERWECVLHFMVGSREAADGVSRDVVEILLHSGLMKNDTTEGAPVITKTGFQFLLMDTQSQVWNFMLQYLETAQSRGQDLVKLLSFLFDLSFSTFGKDYSSESMDEEQLKFLQHLREFGLVYQRKRKCGRYYPTHLAINLASGLSQSSDSNRQGYLVVETNYRIYAYTDSSLQVALLGLFCDLMYRFPNLTVGQVTRDSVRQALLCGITAEQIINFLRGHAHPEMLNKKPVLPPTIVDQIRLWELERDRFKFNDGVLYSQFLSQNDFELLRDYARDIDVLTWENPKQRVMVVTKEGHDDVKKFWKRQKKDSG